MTLRTLLSLMTTADKVLLGVLILTSLGSFALVGWSQEPAEIVVISYGDNHEVRKPLHQDGTFTVTGAVGTTRIAITNGVVQIIESACPQKLCIYQGEIAKGGDILVCAPNKVAVWLEGKRVNEFDAITG